MDFNALIPAIYSTCYEPETWPAVLGRLSDELDIVGCNIFCLDSQNTELNRSWVSPSVKNLNDKYHREGYAELDRSVVSGLLNHGNASQFTSCREVLEMIENKTAADISNYNKVITWLTEIMGIELRAAAILGQEASYWSMLSLQLNDSSQNAVESLKLKAEPMLPHLVKAYEISRPFHLLKQRFNAVLDVLDKFQLGVGLISRSHELIISNNYLKALIADNEDLKTVRGRFISNQLNLGVNCLSSVAPQNVLLLQRKDKLPLQVHLSRTCCPDESSAYAMCIVTDPNISEIVNIAALSSIFELSPAEFRVAEMLVEGLSNPEIAEVKSCSPETIKSHIKSIYSKTGCSNRVGLVNMAHKLSPPVDTK